MGFIEMIGGKRMPDGTLILPEGIFTLPDVKLTPEKKALYMEIQEEVKKKAEEEFGYPE